MTAGSAGAGVLVTPQCLDHSASASASRKERIAVAKQLPGTGGDQTKETSCKCRQKET